MRSVFFLFFKVCVWTTCVNGRFVTLRVCAHDDLRRAALCVSSAVPGGKIGPGEAFRAHTFSHLSYFLPLFITHRCLLSKAEIF